MPIPSHIKRPSLAALRTVFPGDESAARRARKILRMTRDELLESCDFSAYLQVSAYGRVPTYALRMAALGALAGMHGVEYLQAHKDTFTATYGVAYVNAGDVYAPTIVYDHATLNYRVTTVGDLIERNPGRFV